MRQRARRAMPPAPRPIPAGTPPALEQIPAELQPAAIREPRVAQAAPPSARRSATVAADGTRPVRPAHPGAAPHGATLRAPREAATTTPAAPLRAAARAWAA